eukprot:gene26545-29992_t
MEVEARSSDASSRKVLNERVSQYKKAVSQLKSESQVITTQNEKAALMGVSKSGEQRQRLLDTNDRIGRQNEMISNAHRSVLETEEVGCGVFRRY